MPMSDDKSSPEIRVVTATVAIGLESLSPIASATGTVHHPLPQEHPFYATIGRVAAEWTRLEHILDLIIWELASIEPVIGAGITAQLLGAGNRFRSILALGTHRNLNEKVLERTRRLMRWSFDPGEARNRIVHDAWFIQPTSGQLGQFRSMAAKDLRFGLVDIDTADIEKTLSQIESLSKGASELRQQISAELVSLRGKHL